MTKLVVGRNDLATTHPAVAADWHPTKNGELLPTAVSTGSGKNVWWQCSSCAHEWQATVDHRALRGTGCPACAGRVVVPGRNDLATTHPAIAAEWHPTRNGELLPTGVSAGSAKKVWWQCSSSAHEWQTMVNRRSLWGSGCPTCANQIIGPGRNDLATTHPALAAEWHPTKNGELYPTGVSAGSAKKVWWLCSSCAHEWQAAVNYRALRGNGCPACAGGVATTGRKDLATTHPALAAEWHPTKNGVLLPTATSAGSNKKVWWRCSSCAHEWQAMISNRTVGGTGCPACANKTIVPGRNDLATTHPALAAEWHPTKNGDLLPTAVSAGSNKRVWWRCQICAHEWQTKVIYRALDGNGCPACAGRTIGRNDLATTHPAVTAEWHPTKNGELYPTGVSTGSGKKVWWLCSSCAHEWQATVGDRALSGRGCPACANKTIVLGRNDLATTHPSLAAEWHPTKNGDLLPTAVSAGSDKKEWWLCSSCAHEWQATVYNRVRRGSSCPACGARP